MEGSSSGQRGLCLPLKSCLWPYWRPPGRKELKGSGSSSNLGYHPRHQEGCNASASGISGLLGEYRFPGPTVNPENHIYPPGGAHPGIWILTNATRRHRDTSRQPSPTLQTTFSFPAESDHQGSVQLNSQWGAWSTTVRKGKARALLSRGSVQ